MPGQVVSFVSRCKHRKMSRGTVSYIDVGADQERSLSVNEGGVCVWGGVET